MSLSEFEKGWRAGYKAGEAAGLTKAEKIIGSHESPHTEANCRLCKVRSFIER